MNKIKLAILCILCFALPLFAQQSIETNWDDLQNIGFHDVYVKELKAKVMFPNFPANIKSMDGKVVQIEGFVIPFDPTGVSIALSANPYAACYFCGKAGPASVMTIKLTDKKNYRTDAYKKFRGTLRLNDHDPDEFYYILENAEQIKQ